MDILISAEAQEKFDRLPRTMKARVAEIYERLQKWPEVSGAKPLRHDLKHLFRIRTGDWRIIFSVEDEEIRIVDIGHRNDVYKD